MKRRAALELKQISHDKKTPLKKLIRSPRKRFKTMTLTLEAALITGISVLAAAVVWLALYVRSLHNKAEKLATTILEKATEDKMLMVEVVRKNTDAFHGMKTSIELNTVATTNGAEQMRGATDRLSQAVHDLGRDQRNK